MFHNNNKRTAIYQTTLEPLFESDDDIFLTVRGAQGREQTIRVTPERREPSDRLHYVEVE